MTVKDIVIKHLKYVGADGLCRNECGCGLGDFMPCCNDQCACVPAKRIACKPDCPNCDGLGCFVPMQIDEHTEHTRKLITELLGLACNLLSTDPSFY
jgi:hypothetical protein